MSRPHPRVRSATSADLPELLRLFWDSSLPMYERLGATPEEIEAWSRSTDWTDYWQQRVAQRDCRVLVAVGEKDSVIGMLGVIPLEQSTAGLVSIYSRSPGQGTGSALMEAALEAVRELRAEQVELSTSVSNVEMQALATKFGFEPRERFRNPQFPSAEFIRYARPCHSRLDRESLQKDPRVKPEDDE
jgi:RimJ/RimL family protein N-acetyltransferase